MMVSMVVVMMVLLVFVLIVPILDAFALLSVPIYVPLGVAFVLRRMSGYFGSIFTVRKSSYLSNE